MILFISSFEIVRVVCYAKDASRIQKSKFSFEKFSSPVADAAAIKANGIKTLFANVLSTFFIKGKLVFRNHPKRLPKNPPDCTILDRWVFDNFKLADELFTKALRSLETCLSVNNILM